MDSYSFKKAHSEDVEAIWSILAAAILRRKEEGSNQWQDGYPNPEVIRSDIERGIGYILLVDETIVGYCAILINDEPQYAKIKGEWISDGDFVVYHRVAIATAHLRRGLAERMLKEIERWARENKISSLRADTNFDNTGMLRLFEKLNYTYCGEVSFRGSARKAFEKMIT